MGGGGGDSGQMNQDRWEEKSQWKKDTEMKENVRDESEKERQDRLCRGELERDAGVGWEWG